jgi:hypothetical protein
MSRKNQEIAKIELINMLVPTDSSSFKVFPGDMLTQMRIWSVATMSMLAAVGFLVIWLCFIPQIAVGQTSNNAIIFTDKYQSESGVSNGNTVLVRGPQTPPTGETVKYEIYIGYHVDENGQLRYRDEVDPQFLDRNTALPFAIESASAALAFAEEGAIVDYGNTTVEYLEISEVPLSTDEGRPQTLEELQPYFQLWQPDLNDETADLLVEAATDLTIDLVPFSSLPSTLDNFLQDWERDAFNAPFRDLDLNSYDIASKTWEKGSWLTSDPVFQVKITIPVTYTSPPSSDLPLYAKYEPAGAFDLGPGFVTGTSELGTSPDCPSPSSSNADVALVLDRSGSMGFNGFINPAKQAATNFVNLLQNGDGVSVASFNSGARVDFPFTRIQSESDRDAARTAIDGINAGGGTNIGVGINTGLGELPSNTSKTQGMVLLTDGFGPVGNALSNVPENVNIYTIALGPNSDQNLLNNIASQTGGFFRIAPTVGELQGIYDDIRTQVTGQQTIASTSGTISQGQQTSTQAQVDNSTNRSFFSVLWPGSDIDLTLEDPNGRLIDPSTAESDPNISFSSGSTFETYTVDNPVPGTWNLTIVGTDIPDGGEPYTLSASGDSDLTMDIAFDKPSYPLGENIFVSATITDGEAAVTGADVTAEVTTPSQKSAAAMHAAAKVHSASADAQKGQNAVQLSKKGAAYVDENGAVYYRKAEEGLKLYDDGLHGDGAADDGVYANFFSGTNTGGSYTFDVTASGTAPNSGDFTREGSRSTVVSSSAPTANCPGTLGITDFDSDQPGSPDTGEFVEIVNTGPSPASLDGCTLVFFDGANSSSYFAMDLQGSIGPGSIFTAGNAGAGDVAQMFPDNTLQNGPDAMALYRDDATNFPEGTPVTVENLVSAVVYIDDDNVFGTTESSSKKFSTPEEVLMLLNDIDRLMKPEAFVLEQNYPNPFTGRTTIRYGLPEAAEVELIVYDVLGRQVRRLVDERRRAGNHEVVWNGRDVSGNPLASGVYFYRLKAGEFTETRSVRIVR